jgi:AcrR family transcriptional regulator
MSESGGASGGGSGGDRHAVAARLLWGPPPGPARGPRRTLDLGRIARAGIELADAEGLSAVSMQRLAAQLGVTKMALYRYVPGKTELVSLMVDAAMGPCPQEHRAERGGQDQEQERAEEQEQAEGQRGREQEQSGGWRARLTSWAEELLATFLRHPWALDATLGPRVVGPCELGWMERAVAALDGTGLSGAERLDAAVLLTGHVRSISEQARATGPADSPEAQVSALLLELTQAHGERYPALAAALAAAADQPEEQDQAWEFGLQRILDGLAVLVSQRSR